MIFSENMKVLEFILFAKSLVMVLSEILIYNQQIYRRNYNDQMSSVEFLI